MFEYVKNRKFILITVLLAVVCQISDFIAANYFNIHLNQLAIFGLMLNNTLSAILSMLILVLVGWFFTKYQSYQTSLAVLSAGIISNVIDRLVYGGVVDYINFLDIFLINLADILIVASIFVILLANLKPQKNTLL